MMVRRSLESYDLKRAIDDVLDRRFDLHADICLGEATRAIEKHLRAIPGLRHDLINTTIVAQRLRMKGMRRIGLSGSGYNREPVYSRGGKEPRA